MKKVLWLYCLLYCPYFLSSQEILETSILPEVVIRGTGEQDLLLLPCMSCRWNEWEEFMDRNKEKYRMFAVTFPGYGGTLAPNLPLNTEGAPWRNHILQGLSNLLDQYDLKEVTLIGHSWGTMVAIQFAAKRPDVIKRVIAVDGTIESTSWVPKAKKEQLAKATEVIDNWSEKLSNAEAWSQFNGASVGNTYGKTDSVTTERMLSRIKLIASFMATDRTAMLQYWRENLLIDLTASLQQIKAPILDIQSFRGKEQLQQKANYLETLALAKAPANVHPLFMYDTKHFIMYHRPLILDRIINNFINEQTISDFAPKGSKYLEALQKY